MQRHLDDYTARKEARAAAAATGSVEAAPDTRAASPASADPLSPDYADAGVRHRPSDAEPPSPAPAEGGSPPDGPPPVRANTGPPPDDAPVHPKAGPPDITPPSDHPSNEGVMVVDWYLDAHGFPAERAPSLQDDNVGQKPAKYIDEALHSGKPSVEDARTEYYLSREAEARAERDVPTIRNAVKHPTDAEGPIGRGMYIEDDGKSGVSPEEIQEQKKLFDDHKPVLRASRGQLFEPASANPVVPLMHAAGGRTQELGKGDLSPDEEDRSERAIEARLKRPVDSNPERPILAAEVDYNAEISSRLERDGELEGLQKKAYERVDADLARGYITHEQADSKRHRLDEYRQQHTEDLERLRETLDDKTRGSGRLDAIPNTESTRRAFMEEFLVVGEYRLVGLVDGRDGTQFGDVSSVRLPENRDLPPYLFRVWERMGDPGE